MTVALMVMLIIMVADMLGLMIIIYLIAAVLVVWLAPVTRREVMVSPSMLCL